MELLHRRQAGGASNLYVVLDAVRDGRVHQPRHGGRSRRREITDGLSATKHTAIVTIGRGIIVVGWCSCTIRTSNSGGGMAPLQYSREVMTADGTIVSRLMFHFVGNGGLHWLFEWRKRSGDPKDKRQERQGPLFFVSGRLSSRLGRLWEKVHAKAWGTAVKERRRKQRECRGKVHSNHNDES